MARQWGVADIRYELVENWPQFEIKGVTADVSGDSAGRIYTVVRDPKADGSFNDISPGTGHMLVLDRDGTLLETREEGKLSSPHGLWINREDEIFHADCGHHTVVKYSQSGEVLLTLGVEGRPGEPGARQIRPGRPGLPPTPELLRAEPGAGRPPQVGLGLRPGHRPGDLGGVGSDFDRAPYRRRRARRPRSW